MGNKNRSSYRFRAAAKITLISVSYLALAAASANEAYAQEPSPPTQTAPQPPSTPAQAAPQSPSPPAQPSPANEPASPPAAPAQEASSPQSAPSSPSAQTPAQQPLPQVNVEAAQPKPRSTSPVRSAQLTAPRPIVPPPSTLDPNAVVQAAWPVSGTQDARTGTVGVFSNSTSVATKINTPIVNIPQSLSVVTREFIADNAFQNLTDVTRYVPGVAIHQGEGNRDELVIRGVDSSANFFVNGFRDDVQYFRDLYNAQSVEILKGPSAITFGRGAGGGVLNRTLKEADGQRIYEATAQTGSYYDARFTLDAGQAVNENVATRLNAMYEKSDTFRQYGWLERWGINPTATFKLSEFTKVRVSYENFHDARTADRGNPSLALSPVPPPSTRFNPAGPFAPNGDLTAFFGSPNLNFARADVNTVMGFIEHDFANGLTVKNGTYFADFKKFYQNIYPGNGPLAGAVNPSNFTFNRAAYNNTTNRDNTFNDTDFIYKGYTGPLFHTIGFGTQFGTQTGISFRRTGVFPNGTTTTVDSAFAPTYFGEVNFVHQFPGFFSPGVGTPDADSRYTLHTQSFYARDTIEITRYLQLLPAFRVDRFNETALDQNTNTLRNRIDVFVSPQAAAIIKPVETLSIYYAYMVSYLPASGDQFSALNDGTVILAPQKFVNNEVGIKWQALPHLLYSVAVYDLERTNVPLPDPNRPGFFILSGRNTIRGLETELRGFLNDAWQSWLGYAYTDARVSGATSTTILPGNRIQLVPFHQFSWWNKWQFTPVWAASVGVIYFSDSFASSDDTVYLPGFVRVDAGIFATINETWKAQLNVENLFDKGYWASADGNNNLSPGQPRTYRVKLTARC
jgi:catecholate siderophore receptor